MSASADWIEVGNNPAVRTRFKLEREADGSDTLTIWQQIVDPQALVEQVMAEAGLLQGKGWGDGRVIGRIPDTLMYSSGYMQARKNKDEKWVRRFWNDADHKKLRIMPGRV